MAKTYQQIQGEIAQLKKQAEALRQREVAGVIQHMKEAIATYGITPKDLGFSDRTSPDGKNGKKGRNGAPGIVKFKDKATGKTWSGRGRRPQWFSAALQAGQSQDDLRA